MQYGNMGCDGGRVDYAFQYVRDKGIGNKSQNCLKKRGFKIKGYVDIPKGNITALANALHIQPISVAVDATDWQLYAGGIFNNCKKRLNHAVLLVAYDAQGWTIKNSWGDSWGENGFMRLARGDTCGISQMASYSLPP